MSDLVGVLARLPVPGVLGCRIPDDLQAVTDVGDEDDPRNAGTSGDAIESLWRKFCALYRAGVHPGMQLCVRRHVAVAIDRSIGHARGNAPGEGADGDLVPMTTHTPVNLFSAAKAITAMVIHKLDEQRVIHLDDRVCEYVPGSAVTARTASRSATSSPTRQASRTCRPRPSISTCWSSPSACAADAP